MTDQAHEFAALRRRALADGKKLLQESQKAEAVPEELLDYAMLQVALAADRYVESFERYRHALMSAIVPDEGSPPLPSGQRDK